MLARVAVRRSVISAALFGGNACTMAGGPRLPPQVPPHLDAPQQELFDAIVDSRMRIVGRDALFDEAGALRGPWNPEVASPALGRHPVQEKSAKFPLVLADFWTSDHLSARSRSMTVVSRTRARGTSTLKRR